MGTGVGCSFFCLACKKENLQNHFRKVGVALLLVKRAALLRKHGGKTDEELKAEGK
jgi:hypothetical protein